MRYAGANGPPGVLRTGLVPSKFQLYDSLWVLKQQNA